MDEIGFLGDGLLVEEIERGEVLFLMGDLDFFMLVYFIDQLYNKMSDNDV